MQFLHQQLGIIKPSDNDIIEVTDYIVRDVSNDLLTNGQGLEVMLGSLSSDLVLFGIA